MIITAFTPSQKGSQDYTELKKFLEHSSSEKNKDPIKLPEGILEIDSFDPKNSQGEKQILEVINYHPKRMITIDATEPNQISHTLKPLIALIGNSSFNAKILSARFFLITKNTFGTDYELNQLLSEENTTLQALLEKPFHGQASLYFF